MARIRQIYTCFAIAMTCSIVSSHAVFGQYQPIVGESHHDFVLPRIDNRQPVSLSQFRGKKVLLVHFASW